MYTILGILAALGTAAAKSATDISTKVAARDMKAQALIAVAWSLAAVILTALLLLRYPVLAAQPVAAFSSLIRPGFWWILASDGALNAIAAFFYTRAFQLSDASLVAPLMLLTPVFMLLTSPLMLGEYVPLAGGAGIAFAVVGAWLLGKNGGGTSPDGVAPGVLVPFRALAVNQGVRSMLVTVTLWSVTANLDKMGVAASTPLTWAASISVVVAAFNLGFWTAARRDGHERLHTNWPIAAVGCGVAAQALLQNAALTLLLAPYVIAIKRTSAVMTIMVSGALFREPTGNRLAGALIMTLGTALMICASYLG